MKSVYCAVALLLLFCGVLKVTAVLPSPANLTLDTLNTQYVLRWTCPHDTLENWSVTFTAQYISKYKLPQKSPTWLTACENTTDTWCDFTGRNLHYHGMYVLRVRTNSGTERSQWEVKDFCPDKDAALGPPSRVELAVESSVLTVMIYDPMTSRNASMKDDVYGLYFSIQYWKDSDQKKDYKYQNATLNLVSLSDLEPWTMYCLRVQSREGYSNKASVFSATQCRQTSGQSTVWHFMLPFLVSMLVCFLTVLLIAFVILKSYWVVKRTFFPSCQVPSSLLEYLHDSPSSSGQPSLLTLESEEICLRKLEVSPVMASLEVHADMEPTTLQADVSWHGRQDSGDSGLYSVEEHLAMLPEAQEAGMMVNMGADLEDEMSAAPPGIQCWNTTGTLDSLDKSLVRYILEIRRWWRQSWLIKMNEKKNKFLGRNVDMLANLLLCPVFFSACTVAMAVPMPQNVRVEAVNDRYMLKWEWDDMWTRGSSKFTTDYSLSTKSDYTVVCNQTTEHLCDYTPIKLHYFAYYLLRVRAEGPAGISNWSQCLFSPEENASLGPPSRVDVISGNSSLTVQITESLTTQNKSMSSILQAICFEVKYWEEQAPKQGVGRGSSQMGETGSAVRIPAAGGDGECGKDPCGCRSAVRVPAAGGDGECGQDPCGWESTVYSKHPIILLSPLKPWTMYCLQVRAFNDRFVKTSPLTATQCVLTQGHSRLWLVFLILIICVLLLMALLYWNRRDLKELCSGYYIPMSLQGPHLPPLPILQLSNESCGTLDSVETVCLCHPEEESQESHSLIWQQSGRNDSGISSMAST
ncbi:uncharacterized protein [Paramormyrops kingsleyae]